MSDPTTAPLAYMGEDGAFPLEIRRCTDFLLVATLEAGEEHYGKVFAAAPETAERLREVVEAAEMVIADHDRLGLIGCAPLPDVDALRAAIARARGGE